MKGNRTDIDFSEHELTIVKDENVLIHYLKKPHTMWESIKFINTNGILVVTGDYGNWIFCREFHPTKDGYVSDCYWDGKLQIDSVQKSHSFDTDETINCIKKFVDSFYDNYGREMNEEEKDWIDELDNAVFDEHEYIYVAYRKNPSTIHYESVPFGEKRNIRLNIIYDAFDEICRRIKESEK